MNFEETLKRIRKERKITQEEMAKKLNVSRQAISNWENGRNLPDIELIVSMSQIFSISLDELIKGGNMEQKLIKDGSETRRTKINLTLVIIGSFLLVIGALCIIIKGLSVEYIDNEGFLHENFFLLPIGFLFMLSGFLTITIASIKKFIYSLKHKNG